MICYAKEKQELNDALFGEIAFDDTLPLIYLLPDEGYVEGKLPQVVNKATPRDSFHGRG